METQRRKISPELYFVVILSSLCCALSCPTSCTCDNGNLDCSDAALTTVPQDSPIVARVVDFSMNRLASLSPSDLPFVTSTHLDFNSNIISIIQDDTFANFTALISLNLDRNLLTVIRQKMFHNVGSLRLLSIRYNHIKSIENYSFQHLTVLSGLSLLSNDLHEVQATAFIGLDSLRILVLNQNSNLRFNFSDLGFLAKIDNLHLSETNVNLECNLGIPEIFPALTNLDIARSGLVKVPSCIKHLRNLRVLKMIDNNITTVTGDAFANSSTLQELYLTDNRIEKFEVRGLENLRILSLTTNHLRYLPNETFASLESVNSVCLDDNSWHCDCKLSWLVSWLPARQQYCSEPPLCSSPNIFKGRTLLSISAESLCDVDDSGVTSIVPTAFQSSTLFSTKQFTTRPTSPSKESPSGTTQYLSRKSAKNLAQITLLTIIALVLLFIILTIIFICKTSIDTTKRRKNNPEIIITDNDILEMRGRRQPLRSLSLPNLIPDHEESVEDFVFTNVSGKSIVPSFLTSSVELGDTQIAIEIPYPLLSPRENKIKIGSSVVNLNGPLSATDGVVDDDEGYLTGRRNSDTLGKLRTESIKQKQNTQSNYIVYSKDGVITSLLSTKRQKVNEPEEQSATDTREKPTGADKEFIQTLDLKENVYDRYDSHEILSYPTQSEKLDRDSLCVYQSNSDLDHSISNYKPSLSVSTIASIISGGFDRLSDNEKNRKSLGLGDDSPFDDELYAELASVNEEGTSFDESSENILIGNTSSRTYTLGRCETAMMSQTTSDLAEPLPPELPPRNNEHHSTTYPRNKECKLLKNISSAKSCTLPHNMHTFDEKHTFNRPSKVPYGPIGDSSFTENLNDSKTSVSDESHYELIGSVRGGQKLKSNAFPEYPQQVFDAGLQEENFDEIVKARNTLSFLKSNTGPRTNPKRKESPCNDKPGLHLALASTLPCLILSSTESSHDQSSEVQSETCLPPLPPRNDNNVSSSEEAGTSLLFQNDYDGVRNKTGSDNTLGVESPYERSFEHNGALVNTRPPPLLDTQLVSLPRNLSDDNNQEKGDRSRMALTLPYQRHYDVYTGRPHLPPKYKEISSEKHNFDICDNTHDYCRTIALKTHNEKVLELDQSVDKFLEGNHGNADTGDQPPVDSFLPLALSDHPQLYSLYNDNSSFNHYQMDDAIKPSDNEDDLSTLTSSSPHVESTSTANVPTRNRKVSSNYVSMKDKTRSLSRQSKNTDQEVYVSMRDRNYKPKECHKIFMCNDLLLESEKEQETVCDVMDTDEGKTHEETIKQRQKSKDYDDPVRMKNEGNKPLGESGNADKEVYMSMRVRTYKPKECYKNFLRGVSLLDSEEVQETGYNDVMDRIENSAQKEITGEVLESQEEDEHEFQFGQ